MLKVNVGDQTFDNVIAIRVIDDNTMNIKSKSEVDEKKSEDDWQSAYDSTLPDRYVNDNTVDIKGKTISIEVNTDTSTTTGKDTTTVKDTTTGKDTTTSTTTK